MGGIVLPSADVLHFGPADNQRAVKWWAERGLIHYEDTRTTAYDSMPVKTFLERLRAVNDMLSNGKTKENEKIANPDEVLRHMRFVEGGLELARLAKSQGEPSNIDARKAAKIAKPLTVIMPSSVPFSSF